jgi:hypothetical protein
MKKNDILMILIPSFIFVFAWIGFSLLHNIATSTISETLGMQIAPISPGFDTNTIASLKNRKNVVPIYQITVPIQNIVIPASPSAATPTPTPTIIVQPVSSSSAQQATAGGSLAQ